MRGLLIIIVASASLSLISGGSQLLQLRQEKPPKINADKLLRVHNTYRKEVKVPALRWSVELAVYAQELADTLASNCTVSESNGKYGENLYWTSGKRSETEVVEFWAKERKYFECQDNNVFTKEGEDLYPHYAQIIWEQTRFLGAGRRKCDNGDEIWVCCYDPKGNVVGEKVY